MAGIFMGALGGAGEALGGIGATMFKAEIDKDARAQESNLALERAKALEQFKMELGNRERTAQTERIDAAAGKIADTKVGERRAEVERGIVDRAGWTPEQQAAVDQSMAADRQALMGDMKTRTQAAVQTGDIAPKDAATILQKDEALLYKTLWEQQKEEGRNARADARLQAQMESSDKRLAYLFAALEKRGAGGQSGAKEALSFLEGARKEIQSEAQNLRALYQAQIKDASKSERAKIDAEFNPKFADIERKRSEIEEDYNSVRERVGLPARQKRNPPAPAPTPAPAPGGAPPAPKPASRPPLNSFLK
jgi:hypothetical protein